MNPDRRRRQEAKRPPGVPAAGPGSLRLQNARGLLPYGVGRGAVGRPEEW